MWLVTTFAAALIVSVLWYYTKGKYHLSILGWMLWGTTLMVLVDHILGYEGGPFFELETDGLVTNGAVLGLIMLVPVLIIYGIMLLISTRKTNVDRG